MIREEKICVALEIYIIAIFPLQVMLEGSLTFIPFIILEEETSKMFIEQAFYNISRAVLRKNIFEKTQRYAIFPSHAIFPSPAIFPSHSILSTITFIHPSIDFRPFHKFIHLIPFIRLFFCLLIFLFIYLLLWY